MIFVVLIEVIGLMFFALLLNQITVLFTVLRRDTIASNGKTRFASRPGATCPLLTCGRLTRLLLPWEPHAEVKNMLVHFLKRNNVSPSLLDQTVA